MKLKNLTSIVLVLMMVFALAGSASAATINLSSGTTIGLGASNVVVSGTCTNSVTHVPIVLEQGSSSTNVALAVRSDSGPAENYIGFANFPLNVDSGFTTGVATLTAVCPEGNAVVSITLIDPDPAVTPAPTPTPTPTTPTPTPTPTPTTPTPSPSPSTGTSTDSGDVGGVSTTPEGGVAAGKAGLGTIELTLLAALLMGLSGWLFIRKSEPADLTV